MSTAVPVREAERRVLWVAWWLLPLLLAILFPLGKAWAWPLLELDSALAPVSSLKGASLLAFLGGVTGLALAGVWAWSVRIPAGLVSSWRVSFVVALLLSLLAEVVVRQPVVMDALWAAVRARAQSDEDFFIREAALFRRMALTNERVMPRPRLQVVGSSQLIMGVDYDLLQQLRPDLQVERRSVAAMVPARMLMAYPYLGTKTGDTIVVYWSEFDMGGMTSLDVDWYRAFANWTGLRDVWGLLPDGEFRKVWRRSTELLWGAGSELWRSRDAWRILHSRACGPLRLAGSVQDSLAGPSVLRGQLPGYAAGLNNDAYFEMGLTAAVRLLDVWKEAGARVLVLEGSVNPDMDQSRTKERRLQTRAVLAKACEAKGFLYIPAELQSFQPAAGDWGDGTHLTEQARTVFTHQLAEILPQAGSTP